VTTILIGDMTNLENRGLVNGIVSLPYIPNAFIAGYISDGISAYGTGNGWRWGYGMFAILVPACIAPVLFVLFWGDRRAARVGAVSLASSSQARKAALEGLDGPVKKHWKRTVYEYAAQIDGFGLLLMGFAFALLLAPFTLSNTAVGGYTNRESIVS
jgi:MFS family permease